MQDSIFVKIPMQWNWSDVCETGVVPWIIDSNDFAACFQQICFQSPIIILFAITSAHQFGRNYACIVRNKLQMRMLYLRLFAVFSLAVIPCIKIFYYTTHNIFIWPIDVFLCCVYTFTWIIHFVFLLSIRYHGKIDHRGPLIIIVLWLTIFALSLVWLKTSMKYTYWPWALLNVIFNLLYAATLLPNGSATFLHRRNIDDEHQLLLNTSTYIRFQDNIDEMSLGQTYDERNFISKLLFYWVNPLIRKAVAGNLKKVDDLYDLPNALGILKISERMQLQIRQTSSVFKSLHKCFAKEFYCIGLLRLISDLSGFASPLLLSALLTHNSNDTSLPYLYTLGLFGASIFTSFSSTHFNWRISIIAMKMRIGLVTSIYEKSLEANGLTESRLEILNLMSTDTDRIVNSCISFHSCWSIPFQLFTTLYLLYTQIGAAFIAGVIFATALIPINRWIAKKIGILSRGLMTAKDARVSVCAETMESAKQIKLLAWENIFIEKIQNLRKKELSFLSKRKYLDALCVYFWATTPVLMCLLTFGVSVLMGNPLTASTTFTSFALLNMLIGPLNAFPWVLNGLIEAAVSLKRVQELINLPNINLSAFYSNQKPTSSSSLNEFVMQRKNANKSVVLSMKDANFDFGMLRMRNSVDLNNDTILDFKLYIEHLEIRQGDLICLQGPVGCGKSTLLSGILGNLSHKNGTIYLKDYNLGFGYVGQRAWLQRGTIRENIIWGSVYDEQRYSKTLWACALNEDIKILGGDLIGVGEGGRTLSGGQRVRVALARAVYQDKPIYLLDDILSALDGHVANHIIKYCLLGLLKKHTRIIITENQSLLLHANNILNIDGGNVTYCDMTNSSLEEIDDDLDGDTDNEHTLLSLDLIEDDKRSIDSVMRDESKEYGTLSPTVLYTYWTAMSNPIAIVLLLSVILMQATKNLSDVWLAHWVTETTVNNTINNTINDETVHTTNYYLGIYTGIAIINSVITLVRAFLFAYGGVKAAKFIHSTLLNNVFFTKFKFFDITPLGRILNRFSSDTYTIDDSLPFILNILLAQLAGLIGSIMISLYAMPWLFIVIIPMCPIYLSLQNRYRYSSRDIKRLSSNALSPLYAHFTETLQGLTTIRAMRGTNRFKRDFLVKLEESIKSQLTASAAQQWLALRLQYLGAVLVGGAGLLSAITSAHTYNPSMVGLAISYALSITGLLSGVLNTLALFEQELIAMERVDNYCQLKPEKNANGSRDPPFAWPSQGVISFENVHIKYRKHLEPSLQNINFTTSTFERLGIVGRTGAGKSSLLSALLRVAPLSSGRITIDCVDISTLPLSVLRNRIGIVPQEPFLFSGTIRDNLDPQNLHLDSELWNAINNSLATPLVQQLGGLNGYVKSNGSNLSAGQKQLLCMSRALLKNSKIVCIDEGTANLDSDSEAAMQIVLRDAFKTSTVLLIAHRLNSLQKTDRIIVMQNGQIVEEGAPSKLVNTIDSVFSVMLQEQQQ